MLAVGAFLSMPQNGVADIAGQNLDAPRRRYERLGHRSFDRQWITKVVIGERIGDEHRERVGFLSGGAARAPDTDGVFAASAFVLEKFLEDGFLEKIELRLVAEETGLIDREIFQQLCQ